MNVQYRVYCILYTVYSTVQYTVYCVVYYKLIDCGMLFDVYCAEDNLLHRNDHSSSFHPPLPLTLYLFLSFSISSLTILYSLPFTRLHSSISPTFLLILNLFPFLNLFSFCLYPFSLSDSLSPRLQNDQ